jgi:hypothetical protein
MYGDAGDISQIPYQGAGTYASTGSDVALRDAPVISDPPFGPAPGLTGGGSNVEELVQKGDVLDGTADVQNAFARVVHRITGQEGWMSVKYLTPIAANPMALALPQPPPGDVLPGPPPTIVQPAPPPPTPEPAPSGGMGAGGVVLGLLLIVAVGYGLAK